jgi:hypothetical protein
MNQLFPLEKFICHVAKYLAYSTLGSWGWGIRPNPAKSNPTSSIEQRSQDLKVHVSFMDSWIHGFRMAATTSTLVAG